MQVDYLIQEERFSVPKVSVDGGTMGGRRDQSHQTSPFEPSSQSHRNNQHKQIRTRSLNCCLLASIQHFITTLGSILDFSNSPNGLP